MQKSILISIQPQHVFNILTGKKTLELRKTYPKWFAEGWVYIYCTKKWPSLTIFHEVDMGFDVKKGTFYALQDKKQIDNGFYHMNPFDILNGKVVARFWFNIDDVDQLQYSPLQYVFNSPDKEVEERLNLKQLCLTASQAMDYAGNSKKNIWSWSISKLEVFDKPMELSDFQKEEYAVMPNGVFPAYQPITKAPQSWMFTYTNEQLP